VLLNPTSRFTTTAARIQQDGAEKTAGNSGRTQAAKAQQLVQVPFFAQRID
jgi:hypothetical protein